MINNPEIDKLADFTKSSTIETEASQITAIKSEYDQLFQDNSEKDSIDTKSETEMMYESLINLLS